ncbi:ATP-dependent DNA ligase, partial [Candidatus Woesebacteria bacterium]|nr:ATP-dependent DNA ligase [Candidatus Woesebacteria bacterium]
MKFSELAKYLKRLEATASRIEITKILAELFKESSSQEIDKIVYLSLGALAPGYKGIVFNLAERMMIKVIANSSGEKIDKVLAFYKKEGDIGNVAEKLGKKRGDTGDVSEIYSKLYKVAVDEGEGSQERKIEAMAKILSGLDPLSARFVARIPIGKLRLGFSDKTILDALSWMESGDKTAKSELEKVYQLRPDVGFLAKVVKEKGSKKAGEKVLPEIGTPVLPMLSQRLKSPREMVEKMGEVSVEPKLDGLRLQIHFGDGKLKAFTRNLNETSWMFPELKEIKENLNVKEVILDVEVVGIDEGRKILANFQTTMTRRRKHEIEGIAAKIPVVFYVFDIILVDGKSLMDKPYTERRKELERAVKEGKLFRVVEHEITTDAKRITVLNKKRRGEGLEGIMVKKVSGAYVPGRTGWR